MTANELLDYLSEHEEYWTSLRAQRWAKVPAFNALRAVVELAFKQLETKDMPAEQVGWFNEGYNLAMDNIIQAIEKELT